MSVAAPAPRRSPPAEPAPDVEVSYEHDAHAEAALVDVLLDLLDERKRSGRGSRK